MTDLEITKLCAEAMGFRSQEASDRQIVWMFWTTLIALIGAVLAYAAVKFWRSNYADKENRGESDSAK